MADKLTQQATDVATTSTTTSGETQAPRTMLGTAGAALGGGVLQRKVLQRQAARTPALAQRLRVAHTSHDETLRNIGVEDRSDADRVATSSTADGTTNVTEELQERDDAQHHHHRATGSVADLRVGSNPAVHAAMLDADTKRHQADHPPRGMTREAAIAAYEVAVTTLRNVYLASPLYSSDNTAQRGATPWAPVAGVSIRLSAAQPADLQAFQTANRGFVKYVIPFNMPPGTPAEPNPDVIVGRGSHVDIAQGAVRAAGLLVFTFPEGGGRPTVAEAENTSGGFRPGPLRNALAQQLIVAAGYAVVITPNPDGSYASSPGHH